MLFWVVKGACKDYLHEFMILSPQHRPILKKIGIATLEQGKLFETQSTLFNHITGGTVDTVVFGYVG